MGSSARDIPADPADQRHRLAEVILAESRRAGLGSGAKLPTERQLAAHLGATRTSVRRALAVLEADGRISREVGRGTFLRDALANKHEIPAENIILGGGSTELIDLSARLVLRQADCGLTSYGSFPLYYIAIRATGARYVEVPQRDYHFDLDSMAEFLPPETKRALCQERSPIRFTDRFPTEISCHAHITRNLNSSTPAGSR